MPVVEIPGVGAVEFPDTMSTEAIQTQAARLAQPETGGVNPLAVAAVGAGGAAIGTGAVLGAKRVLGSRGARAAAGQAGKELMRDRGPVGALGRIAGAARAPDGGPPNPAEARISEARAAKMEADARAATARADLAERKLAPPPSRTTTRLTAKPRRTTKPPDPIPIRAKDTVPIKVEDKPRAARGTKQRGVTKRELASRQRGMAESRVASETVSGTPKPLPEGLTIHHDVTNYSKGETYGNVHIRNPEGRVVAALDYGQYGDEGPNIKMLATNPEFRRKGLATNLYRRLEEEFPGKKIIRGMATPEGSEFLKSIDKPKTPNVPRGTPAAAGDDLSEQLSRSLHVEQGMNARGVPRTGGLRGSVRAGLRGVPKVATHPAVSLLMMLMDAGAIPGQMDEAQRFGQEQFDPELAEYLRRLGSPEGI